MYKCNLTTNDIMKLHSTLSAVCVAILFSTSIAFSLSYTAPSTCVDHFGTHITPTSTSFRVWGPECSNIFLTGSFNGWNESNLPLAPDTSFDPIYGGPYWSIEIDQVLTGEVYRYSIVNDEGVTVNKLDPWTRNVDWARGGAEVVDISGGWLPFTRPNFYDMVLYELHPGTFHDDFDGIADNVDYLKHLGINAVQLMPSAEFGGELSWGYNPEGYYAPESSYGGFHAWKRMVNALHSNGIAVLNDVVYNHSSGGEFIWQWNGKHGSYDPDFVCGKCYQYIPEDGGMFYYGPDPSPAGADEDHSHPWNSWHTYWGHNRLNFSQEEVRWYIRNNMLYWIQDMHADGLRVDSTITIRHLHWDKAEFIPAGNSLLRWTNISREDAGEGSALMVAEDTQNDWYITTRPQKGEGDGCGFDTQWHNPGVHALRGQMKIPDDSGRDINTIRDQITWVNNGDFTRLVKYISCHDENANGHSRLNVEIDYPNGTGYWAKKKTTLGAGIVMTSAGIPMMFQGDEILMDKWFSDAIPLDWSRLNTYGGITECYRGMIMCRRNMYGNTKGLTGSGVYVFHENNGYDPNWGHKVLGFTRYFDGGGADDVLVIINAGNDAFGDYDMNAGVNSFLGWDWYLQYTSNRKCYDEDFGGNSKEEEATHHSNNGHFYIGPYSVNIYGLSPLPAPVADFKVSETSGTLPRLVRFYNRSTSIPRWFNWNITGPGISTNIAPDPNPTLLITQAGTYDVSLTAYVQQDNTTEVSDTKTVNGIFNFTPSGWVNGAAIPSDVPAQFSGPLATAVQDTHSDRSEKDTLAALRVFTNDNNQLHISVSGSLGTDSAFVLFLDTDAAEGSTTLPLRGGCNGIIREMAGMTFDDGFTPDHAFIIKPRTGANADEAWLDYSSIKDNNNIYLGSIDGFANGAGVFSNGYWQVGLFNALSAGNITGSDAQNFAFGTEIVADYDTWNIYTTNLKIQAVICSHYGTEICNQSLPGTAGSTNASTRSSSSMDYTIIPGNQYLGVGVDTGVSITYPPRWNNTPDQQAVAGSVASFSVSGYDPEGEALTVASSDPTHFTDVGSGSGVYSWATLASDVGQYFIDFYITDASGLAATQTVMLYITPQGLNTNIIFDGMNIVSDFADSFASTFQDTAPDWTPDDFLAGMRIVTNSQQLIIGLSGVTRYNDGGGNGTLAILLDTDPMTGSNILPDLDTISWRARSMNGMTLDTDFTPEYVLTIGLDNNYPAQKAWTDLSKLTDGGYNNYLGELLEPVSRYGTIYDTDYILGYHLSSMNTNIAHVTSQDTGLEIALRFAALNTKTNFMKIQALVLNNSGSEYANQSLPPIQNTTEYDSGACSDARFDLVPGDQHLTVSIPLVEDANHAPVLAYIGNQEAVAGETLTFDVTAIDDDGTTPQLLANNIPTGATFTTNGATGTFTWHTITADLGDYYVTFRAFDGQFADSETVHIKVAEDRISWCNLQWPYTIASTVSVAPNDTIYGRVYVPGKTYLTGASEDISAQLGYGEAATPPESWTWVDASFAYDKEDGSDEYKTVFAAEETTGTYYYAYRYRYAPEGTDWVYGTKTAGRNVTVSLADAGVWTVTPLTDSIADANLQWPYTMSTYVDEESPNIYGRVYIPTQQSNLPASQLTVDAGYGADAASFTWYPATYNTNYGAYGEYTCIFPINDTYGIYYYAFRYTYQTTNIVYGLTDGMHSTLSTNTAGVWNVIPEPTTGMIGICILLFTLFCKRKCVC